MVCEIQNYMFTHKNKNKRKKKKLKFLKAR